MKKRIVLKTFIPAVLLIVVLAALAFVSVYALLLKSSMAESYSEISSPTPASDTPAPLRTAVPVTPSPEPTIEPIAHVDPTEQDDASEAEQPYWSDGVLFINDTYRSPTMSVTVTTTDDSEMFGTSVVYYVADIRVSDVTQIQTACNSGNFTKAGRGEFDEICEKANALVAISGDYCPGLIIRNGEVYRNTIGKGDICLLLRNGEMVTLQSSDTSIKKILEMDPWQAWEFGPALFDSKGYPIVSYPGVGIATRNPRSCIGYIEPGHYCLVVVDGRQKASRGVTLSELAMLMQSLGCTQAYNLDGGASAHFYYDGTVLNHPSGGGRVVADIVYVAREAYPESPFYFGKAGLSK